MTRTILLLLTTFSTLAGLTACTNVEAETSSPPSPSPAAKSVEADTPSIPSSTPAATSAETGRIMEGLYYYGHEVEAFTACNSDIDYWVFGDPELLKPIQTAARGKSMRLKQPYQPIYIKGKFILSPPATDGFAEDYDGLAELISLESFSDETEECKD